MKKVIECQHAFVLVSFCLAAVLLSCSPKVTKVPIPETSVSLGISQINEEVHKRAFLLRQGVMEGKGSLLYPDGHKQKVRFLIHWSFENELPKVRAVGLGPFGITLFEFLAVDGNAYFMVPSRNITYVASKKELAANKTALVAARQFVQIINPWFQLEQIEKGSDTKNRIVATYLIGSVENAVMFDSATFMPLKLVGPDIEVFYGADALHLEDGNIFYPKDMKIRLNNSTLSLEIEIKKVRLNSEGLDEGLFDIARFVQFTIRPWHELFHERSS